MTSLSLTSWHDITTQEKNADIIPIPFKLFTEEFKTDVLSNFYFISSSLSFQMIHTVMAEWQHHLTYILLTLFMGEMGQVTQGQRLPTRDEKHFQFQISHAEIFYDTKLLPDGAEVSSYIFHNELNRLVDSN